MKIWIEEKTTDLLSWLFFVILLSILFLGGTRGFFADDYFSLWGIHAKTVWATGKFFTTGQDLNYPFPYQSIVGSLVGSVWRLLSPFKYNDALLGLVNAALVLVGLIFSLRWILASSSNNRKIWLFCAVLLILKPVEWGQFTFGGYQDLLGTFFLVMVIWACLEKQLLWYSVGVLTVLFLKQILFPWIGIAWIACTLSFIYKKQLAKNLRWCVLTLATAVISYIIQKYAYPSTIIVQEKFYFQQQAFKWYPWALSYPPLFLGSNNGLGLLALLAVIKMRSSFWSLYFLGGFFYVWLTQIAFIGPTPHETFPSLNRYTLPVTLVPVLFFIRNLNVPKTQIFKIALIAIVTLLFVVRSAEEIGMLVRDGLKNRASIAARFPHLKNEVIPLKKGRLNPNLLRLIYIRKESDLGSKDLSK